MGVWRTVGIEVVWLATASTRRRPYVHLFPADIKTQQPRTPKKSCTSCESMQVNRFAILGLGLGVLGVALYLFTFGLV